jgi:hypothetical protein
MIKTAHLTILFDIDVVFDDDVHIEHIKSHLIDQAKLVLDDPLNLVGINEVHQEHRIRMQTRWMSQERRVLSEEEEEHQGETTSDIKNDSLIKRDKFILANFGKRVTYKQADKQPEQFNVTDVDGTYFAYPFNVSNHNELCGHFWLIINSADIKNDLTLTEEQYDQWKVDNNV